MTVAPAALKPAIAVLVPSRDSFPQLQRLLLSLRQSTFKDFEVVINADPRSTDDHESLLSEFSDLHLRILTTNTSRAAGRFRAAESTQAPVLLHLDSDMTVTPELLGDCVQIIESGCSALVVNERSVASNFWGDVRALEKQCYEGEESVEALRCLTADVYSQIGGHDVQLVWAEDKDLDLRVRKAGIDVGRTTHYVIHDEGAPTLRSIFRKKLGYLGTARDYAERHPEAFAQQISIFDRVRVLLRHWKLGVRHPLRFAGILIIGATEVAALICFRLQSRFAPSSIHAAT